MYDGCHELGREREELGSKDPKTGIRRQVMKHNAEHPGSPLLALIILQMIEVQRIIR